MAADVASGGATIQGTVGRVVHRSDEGFIVARVHVEGDVAPVSVVGVFAGAEVGSVLRLTGEWHDHPRFGRQFRVQWAMPVLPETALAMERFLASGMVEGIGPVMAKRLVASFGTDTLEVIDKHPSRLRTVDGIGPKRAVGIRAAWQAHQAVREVMFFLQGHGVGTVHAARILAELGDQAVPAVSKDPYILADRIRGIGFLTADRIAGNLGFAFDDPARVEAGLQHVLDRAADDGHCALPRGDWIDRSRSLLRDGEGREPDAELFDPAVARLCLGGRVTMEPASNSRGEWAYPSRLHQAELRVARALASLVRTAVPEAVDVEGAASWVEGLLQIRLAPLQRRAVGASLRYRLVVVTGGPGTGKTTVVRSILEVARRAGRSVLLAAPTGRAAHRLGEATGAQAKTLHRLLEFSPKDNSFLRNSDRPLEADLIVVDETSMVDLMLMDRLVAAVTPGTTLLLVGDADQLPSVGPGNVLADVIASGVAEVVRLERVFRQADRSLIVRNAHRMLSGELPMLPEAGERKADFYWFERESPEEVVETIVHLCAERIPKGFDLDPFTDVQVLSPMHRGLVGAQSLNESLQRRLNPDGIGFDHQGRPLREGDKVMQVRNNYQLDVFNGDIGRIRRVDLESLTAVVELQGRVVEYQGADLADLQPAFAVTIHKSQGSEYPAVVVPIHTQHWIMLRRDLLYTAITRARRLVVVVGSRRALRRAVENAETNQRHTALATRLRGVVAAPG